MNRNNNIITFRKLIKSYKLLEKFPSNDLIDAHILNTRNEISDIINKKTNKKIIIVGPCSIHNIDQAKIYAEKLIKLKNMVSDKILIIMRVYFEKPRTTIMERSNK